MHFAFPITLSGSFEQVSVSLLLKSLGGWLVVSFVTCSSFVIHFFIDSVLVSSSCGYVIIHYTHNFVDYWHDLLAGIRRRTLSYVDNIGTYDHSCFVFNRILNIRSAICC